MAELTAEIVQTLISSALKGLRTGMSEGFEQMGQRFDAMDRRFVGIDQRFEAIDGRFDAIDQRFDAIDGRFDRLTSDMTDGLQRVLDTVQELHQEQRDEAAGIKGRLRYHNDRIAKLERINNLG